MVDDLSIRDLETGDIILKRGRGISKIVGWFTDSEYSHAAIVYDSPIIVHSHALGVKSWDIYSQKDFDVYRIRGGLTESEKQEVKRICIDFIEEDIKYDYKQLLAYTYYAICGGKNKFNNPSRYICSELIDKIYYILGYILIPDKMVGDCTPAHVGGSVILNKLGRIII